MKLFLSIFMTVVSVLGFPFSFYHLYWMMKKPKETRLWWGSDVIIQLLYPIYILGIIIGIHNIKLNMPF